MADAHYSPNGSRTSISNAGKPTRTSLSILKPLKARCPLQDLDLLPNTEDDTTSTTSTFTTMRRRRVSFAGVNKVKEFYTAAESLTVHHTPAYDEPFTTTMSSDSSSHHHLTDSKISDGIGLEHMSPTSRINTNFASEIDTVLDLTVKSTNKSCPKGLSGLDFECKENFADNFPQSQNTCYETDMEYATPIIPNHLCYDSKNSSFVNRNMELTSEISDFLEGTQSNKSSMMEFTEVVHGPTSFLQNESDSKQFVSTEFTEQVETGTAVDGKDFEDSFSSAYHQSNANFFQSIQNDSDFGMEFNEPLHRVDIFNSQHSTCSKSGPILFDPNPLGQVNSIFSSQGNVTNNDFNDSNEMSFGMTGVVPQPLIECLQNGELVVTNNTAKDASFFGDFVNQNIEVENSNAEGSEMSITEANVFSNPLNAIHHVSVNLETGKKLVFENNKVKQSDHVLSFLRSYSGTEKGVSAPPTSLNLSLECTEAVKKSIIKPDLNSSNDHQLTNSHLGDVSVVKSQSMELTNALSNNVKSNSCVNETSAAQTSTIEFSNLGGNNVHDMSVSRNSSMEFTKAVTNNIRLDNTNSNLGNLSTLSNNMKSNSSVCETSPTKTSTMDFTNIGSSNVNDMSVSRNSSMEFTKAVSNNLKLGGTNFSSSDVSFLANNTKSNSSVSGMSISKTSPMELAHTVKNCNSDSSISISNTMEFTNAVPNNIRFVDRILSSTEDPSKLVTSTSGDIFSKTAETNSVERFLEKESSNFDTKETMSCDLKENSRITNHIHNSEDLLEDKCETMLDAIDFNATNVITSTQETKSSENIPLSENLAEEKSATASDTGDFNASNFITFAQDSNPSQNVIATNGRKSISVEAFLRMDAPVARKGGVNFDCVNREISAMEMELTKNISKNIQSSNLDFSHNLSQLLSKTNEEQCHENKPASSQETCSSQPIDSINVNAFDEKTIPDSSLEINNSLSNATSRVGSVKNKSKSRRSELFVPLLKPSLSREQMNVIEESEFSNSCNNIYCESSFQAVTTVNEIDDADKMRCESLSSQKPVHVLNLNMVKPKLNKSEVSFDCSYKINDSQMFAKSMLEQTSHDESCISEPLKPNNLESLKVGSKTGSTLLASMKSFNIDEASLSSELFTSLNIENKKVLSSQSSLTRNATFQQNDVIESILNEDTRTFSHFLKTPLEASKNSPLIKPMMNSTIMANIFEESQFTLPVENIPRSIFLKDDVSCPSFSNKSGLTLPDVFDYGICGKQSKSAESSLEKQTVDSHESSAKIEQTQKFLDDKNLIEEANEVSTNQDTGADNNDGFQNNIGNGCAKEDNLDSPDLCNVSFPEITINEEMLKNITVDRYKSRKSIRKERCLTELDDSITLRHEESVKKVKTFEESCNITGITKLPDFTVSSAGVSPLSDKSVLLADENKMDVSVMVENLSINDQNNMCILDCDHENPEKLGDDNDSKKSVNKMHELEVNINTSSLKKPENSFLDHSKQPNLSETKVNEFTNIEQEQNPKTPKSCLKKAQNLSSAAKSTVANSAPEQANTNSGVKNVYFVESGPRKRGFVRKAATLYESFVATTTPVSEQIKTATKLSEFKRVLDENYPKERGTHLKVQQYLEAVAPIANTSIVTDMEADFDMTTPKRVVPKESHVELSTLSVENNFEKSSYALSASSNTSMIVHDDHASNISPIFKTPKSMVKNRSFSSIASPNTPFSSPARKKQKLPFGSTPVKNFNSNEDESKMQASDCGSQHHGNNSIPNFESSSEAPSPKKLCSEFLERFEAETRATKTEWNVLKASSTEWFFEFLDGHLQLIIHFKPASANAPVSVKSITFSSVHSDDKPVQVIGQKILLEKYPAQRLRSLCKNSSSVFDVLHMIGNDAIFARKVMNSLEGMFLAVFTNSSAVIELTSLRPNHLAEVTIDLSSWKSLSSSSISIENWIGNIRLPKIRSLFEECEKNHDCVLQFYNKCYDYINNINCTEAAS